MRNKFLWLVVGALFVGAFLAGAAAPASAAGSQDFVWGTVRFENGFYTYSKVYPLEVIEDQFFRYWVGRAEGRVFLFDPFKQIWYPPPVQYLRTTLEFRGRPIEGFARVWGRNTQFVDKNYFFGVDGVIYELHRKYRRVGLAGRKHRRLVKSWYVNTLTGERSDWAPRTPEEQEAYISQLRALPQDAFPRWAEPLDFDEPPPSTTPATDLGEGADGGSPSETTESGAATDEEAPPKDNGSDSGETGSSDQG
ncbi:MAG: hypothetical protein B1H03_04085 [Planctomycetales bacterium 4484_113]|nr:MAG: hypothetical protein B1H03_04085 [Planctomycetales bacterium 4484_113]